MVPEVEGPNFKEVKNTTESAKYDASNGTT